jgi:hypothetical protein
MKISELRQLIRKIIEEAFFIGEDDIDTTQPCDYGNQPFKIGYLVLDNPIFALLK